jgi:hypothetical protein
MASWSAALALGVGVAMPARTSSEPLILTEPEHSDRSAHMAVWLLPQAWDAMVAALASDKAQWRWPPLAASCRASYARCACSWGELEGRLAGAKGGWLARLKQRLPGSTAACSSSTCWEHALCPPCHKPQVAVARQVVRTLVGLELRLRSGEALARLCAMWGDAGLHRGVRLLLVREMGALAGEAAAQQVGVECLLASRAARQRAAYWLACCSKHPAACEPHHSSIHQSMWAAAPRRRCCWPPPALAARTGRWRWRPAAWRRWRPRLPPCARSCWAPCWRTPTRACG